MNTITPARVVELISEGFAVFTTWHIRFSDTGGHMHREYQTMMSKDGITRPAK